MRTLVDLVAAAALAHTGLDAIGAFVVAFAVSVSASEGLAGILLTIRLAGLVLRLASGYPVDRRQHTGLPWMAALLLTGSVWFLVLAAGGTFLGVGILLAIAGGWGWAGLLTFVVVRANPDALETAPASPTLASHIGAATRPALFGYLAERVSFTLASSLACGVLLLAAIIVTVIRLSPSGIQMAGPPSERNP